MIPQHCGDVGVEEVSFSLTEENLRKHFLGRKSYTRTKFYAVRNGKDWAVVQISKKLTKDLFQPVQGVNILSLPDRTTFVHEPGLDVLHIGNLLKVQSRHRGKLVVFKGRFEHVSFVDVPLPAKIRVVDIIPPAPSKLLVLVRELVGEDSSYLDIETRLVDIADLIKGTKEDILIMPCKASYEGVFDRSERRRFLYLDQAPALSKDQLRSSLLVGCSLSERIFEEIYGMEPKLANICVRDTMKVTKNDLPTISRCCKIKDGIEVDRRMILVPWGATVCEVAEALRIALSF